MRRAVEPSRGSLARGWELDIRAQLSFFYEVVWVKGGATRLRP